MSMRRVLALSEVSDSSSRSHFADDLTVVLEQVKDRLCLDCQCYVSHPHSYCLGLEKERKISLY
jgi:hypothetical protein